MSERITKENLQNAVENVNRRMEERGSKYRYEVVYAYGRAGIDRLSTDGHTMSDVRRGTKSEMYEWLYAMMVALDDAEVKESVNA